MIPLESSVMQQFELLRSQFSAHRRYTCDIAARVTKAGNKTALDRIDGDPKHDRNCRRRSFAAIAEAVPPSTTSWPESPLLGRKRTNRTQWRMRSLFENYSPGSNSAACFSHFRTVSTSKGIPCLVRSSAIS
jgi:hypothetical protein